MFWLKWKKIKMGSTTKILLNDSMKICRLCGKEQKSETISMFERSDANASDLKKEISFFLPIQVILMHELLNFMKNAKRIRQEIFLSINYHIFTHIGVRDQPISSWNLRAMSQRFWSRFFVFCQSEWRTSQTCWYFKKKRKHSH